MNELDVKMSSIREMREDLDALFNCRPEQLARGGFADNIQRLFGKVLDRLEEIETKFNEHGHGFAAWDRPTNGWDGSKLIITRLGQSSASKDDEAVVP